MKKLVFLLLLMCCSGYSQIVKRDGTTIVPEKGSIGIRLSERKVV